eukprot:1159459-Pelagomonas_calceolata.AAC.1
MHTKKRKGKGSSCRVTKEKKGKRGSTPSAPAQLGPGKKKASRDTMPVHQAVSYLELKTLRDLFSIAPMLKSSTATMLNRFRSYSRPKVCVPHSSSYRE